MKTVAIVGVGLIGGSFGLALRAAGFTGELLGVSSKEVVEEALKVGAIDRGVPLAEAAQKADLMYLAQPVDRILETIVELGKIVNSDCLITDAGSTKQMIVAKAEAAGLSRQFLGGHPMAGKERAGVSAAESDLFRKRPYILTPVPQKEVPFTQDGVPFQEFRSWLNKIGAKVLEVTPEEHDRTVALTSHVPQIVATALALTLARSDDPLVEKIFGPGLLDMTRLAMSSPHLWTGILATNIHSVDVAIDMFVASIREIQKSAATKDLESLFESASSWAGSIRKSND